LILVLLLIIFNPYWQVEAREVGTPDTPGYRVFFYNTEGKKISPWHDIALTEPGTRIEQGVLRYVVEIPKGYSHHARAHPCPCKLRLRTLSADIDRLNRTDQKMEIATDEPWNPIKQDTRKDGALR
jgi:inorganic pyrophosphatase